MRGHLGGGARWSPALARQKAEPTRAADHLQRRLMAPAMVLISVVLPELDSPAMP